MDQLKKIRGTLIKIRNLSFVVYLSLAFIKIGSIDRVVIQESFNTSIPPPIMLNIIANRYAIVTKREFSKPPFNGGFFIP